MSEEKSRFGKIRDRVDEHRQQAIEAVERRKREYEEDARHKAEVAAAMASASERSCSRVVLPASSPRRRSISCWAARAAVRCSAASARNFPDVSGAEAVAAVRCVLYSSTRHVWAAVTNDISGTGHFSHHG